jgi:hypothetical protein
VTRSVSALAAPVFSAALLGRRPAQPLALSNVPLRVLETTVPERWAGQSIRDVHRGAELRVLALAGDWRPAPERELTPGAAVSIVGTREACDTLLSP